MDNKIIHHPLITTPIWQVLDYLLQHPDLEESDSEIVAKIYGTKKSAINVALRRLAAIHLIERQSRGRMIFNKLLPTPLIIQLKIVSNLLYIQPTVEKLQPFCSKIVLFGSRAFGTHTFESDYDLFVVANHIEKVLKKINKTSNIQIIFKNPAKMLSFSEDEPELSKEVKKGIVLWEKN